MTEPKPAPLHAVPLPEILAYPDAPQWMAWDWDRKHAGGWADLEARVARDGLRATVPLTFWAGYALVAAGDWPDGVLAALAPDGTAAGGVLDGNLFVCKAHRGNGLASALMVQAFAIGLKRPGEYVQLSVGGRATRRAAHQLAVRQALDKGEAVDETVLADYPDLWTAAPAA